VQGSTVKANTDKLTKLINACEYKQYLNNTHRARHTQSGIPWHHALQTTAGYYQVHVQRDVARGRLKTKTSCICINYKHLQTIHACIWCPSVETLP